MISTHEYCVSPSPNIIDTVISKYRRKRIIHSRDENGESCCKTCSMSSPCAYEPEEYITFIIAEAFNAQKGWIFY